MDHQLTTKTSSLKRIVSIQYSYSFTAVSGQGKLACDVNCLIIIITENNIIDTLAIADITAG